MREVNFSVPSANRASVGITTALYDRRALDCTSTLPLVNSLNHLAYLTTSSPRIREILTIDGGIEKLVYLLKCGKSKEMMDTWKWSLAFQCVVNVAVRGSDSKGSDSRGSENIRTRVVEADIVPVITTILDNYMQVAEKIRARQDDLDKQAKIASSKRPLSREDQAIAPTDPRRRHAPPPIDASLSFPGAPSMVNTPEDPIFRPAAASSPPPPPPPPPSMHGGRALLNSDSQEPTARPRNPWLSIQATGSPLPSQPNTPTSPLPLGRLPVLTTRYPTRRRSASAGYLLPVTTQQQDPQLSGDSDDGDVTPQRAGDMTGAGDIEVEMGATAVDPSVLGDATADLALPDPDVTGDGDAETFNITHRSLNGSIIDPIAPPADAAIAMSPPAPPFAITEAVPQSTQAFTQSSSSGERTGLMSTIARDEDVIMALQLLAYVSKYCHLRTYFENSHLVPKLKIGRDLAIYENPALADQIPEEDNDDEYCQPSDYNIFPLIEKYTVRQYTADMNYWACVVMRNLCRKDKTRGDIRQCAYWKCGRWEECARQFAKCRRCRQTKYCSKACQKQAWLYHRHWCEPAKETRDSHGHGHGHGHHRSSRHAGGGGEMEVDSELPTVQVTEPTS